MPVDILLEGMRENPKSRAWIEELAIFAMVDPEERRTEARKLLVEQYGEKLKGGCVINSQVFLVLQAEGDTKLTYVCDLPKDLISLKTYDFLR